MHWVPQYQRHRPENQPTKKFSRKKEKIPAAVTSKEWQEYHEKKETVKKRLLQEKEEKAKLRIEKRKLKEDQAKEKNCKIIKDQKKKKGCVKKCSVSVSSSDDTDTEIKYVESGESVMNEHSDSTWCDDEIVDGNILSGKGPIRKPKKGLNIGSFVIVKYEGEYFPGKIVTVASGQYEVSTMVLSTGNTFRWPERQDKIWYRKNDIVQPICPPTKYNNRGFYKVPDMGKFLPDIYLN